MKRDGVNGTTVVDSDLRAVQWEIDSANAIFIQAKSVATRHQGGYTANDAEEKSASTSRRFLSLLFRISQAVLHRDMSDFRAKLSLQKSKLFSLTLPLAVIGRHRDAEVMILWLFGNSSGKTGERIKPTAVQASLYCL